jgi:hypothetical protein
MSKVIKDVDSLLKDFEGLPEYVYASRIIQAAKDEILRLQNAEAEADYFKTLCEGYEQTSL